MIFPAFFQHVTVFGNHWRQLAEITDYNDLFVFFGHLLCFLYVAAQIIKQIKSAHTDFINHNYICGLYGIFNSPQRLAGQERLGLDFKYAVNGSSANLQRRNSGWRAYEDIFSLYPVQKRI